MVSEGRTQDALGAENFHINESPSAETGYVICLKSQSQSGRGRRRNSWQIPESMPLTLTPYMAIILGFTLWSFS